MADTHPGGDGLDVEAMIGRFQERARRVKDRSIPPVAGPERQRYIDQAQLDYLDFAVIGDAEATLDDGVLTLRIDLRPGDSAAPPRAGPPDAG